MTNKKVGALAEGDIICFRGDYFTVTGVDWSGPHDCRVYVCNEQATDWRLPLEAGDIVELIRSRLREP